MIKYKVSKHAKILFVGINPHHGSNRRGVPFSNNKMFWYLLNRAGLLEETEGDLRDDRMLKSIYDKKFLRQYGLNFVNLVDRPTRDVMELKKGEEQKGVRRLWKIIRTMRPKVICFIGKVTFKTFQGCRQCQYGWQNDLDHSKVYVMHFPIRGPASVRVRELREINREAKRATTEQADGKLPAISR